MSPDKMPIANLRPDANRHAGFSYADEITGFVHRVSRLRSHPEDPQKQVGTLTIYDELSRLVGEPVEVELPESPVMATQPLELEVHHSRKKEIAAIATASISTVVALGSLVVWYRKSHNKSGK